MSSKFGTKINVDAVIGCLPKKAHENDAAYDLFVKERTEISPNQRCYISLGFRIQLPPNMKLQILPRSGQSGKGMILNVDFPSWLGGGFMGKVRENCDVIVGLIDCGYGKDVKAIVKSGSFKWKHRLLRLLGFKFYLASRDRICQGAFTYVPDINMVEGPVNGTREGLGSTDKVTAI